MFSCFFQFPEAFLVGDTFLCLQSQKHIIPSSALGATFGSRTQTFLLSSFNSKDLCNYIEATQTAQSKLSIPKFLG